MNFEFHPAAEEEIGATANYYFDVDPRFEGEFRPPLTPSFLLVRSNTVKSDPAADRFVAKTSLCPRC